MIIVFFILITTVKSQRPVYVEHVMKTGGTYLCHLMNLHVWVRQGELHLSVRQGEVSCLGVGWLAAPDLPLMNPVV